MKHASMLFLCLLESTNFDALLYFFFFEKYVIKFRAKIYCKQGCITCCMFLCVKILERHLSRTNLKKISVKFLTLTFGCITCCMLLCVKILERHLSRTNLKKTSVKFLTFLSLSLSLSLSLFIYHMHGKITNPFLSLSLSFLLRSFHFSDTQPQNQIKIQIP